MVSLWRGVVGVTFDWHCNTHIVDTDWLLLLDRPAPSAVGERAIVSREDDVWCCGVMRCTVRMRGTGFSIDYKTHIDL